MKYGPTLPISEEIDRTKYRQEGEDFYNKVIRIAGTLKDDRYHFEELKAALLNQRFIPAGRVQNASVLPDKPLLITALSVVPLATDEKYHGESHRSLRNNEAWWWHWL